MRFELTPGQAAVALAAAAVVSAAIAASSISVKDPFALSDGIMGDKPKLQRAGDGTLVVAYGDSPAGAGWVYDVKAAEERTARDIFVKTCKPGTTRPDAVVRTCDVKEDWSAAVNVSKSALLQSAGTFAWRGTLNEGARTTYPGDVDKANIKTSGPMMVLTWVSKHCPDGDLASAEVQPSVQRGIQYQERNGRVIPFSCTYTAYSTNKGAAWSAPIQLSTGERDAIQDASNGNIGTDSANLATYNKGQINISWQEDPQGLPLGEADGPGDGASGANANGGTDIWYAHATVDLSQPSTPSDDFVLAPAVRLTDNLSGYGVGDSLTTYVLDGAGQPLNGTAEGQKIEIGQTAASRANIGMVGTTAIVAYEESKDSGGLDNGKFVRYHAFKFNQPVNNPEITTDDLTANNPTGCIISDPAKNARRVRFLTQSPTDAGAVGIQLGIFWKEGAYDKGGPSDIRVRRGMGGLQPGNMVPAVDAACVTSSYAAALALTSAKGDNVSSMSASATAANLSDDTELNNTENALAHRGVLRGQEMWIGYSYTADLAKLWVQQDNYNFWVRRFNMISGWDSPKNVTQIVDKGINVREPRIFGTPKSNQTTCPTGIPADPTTTHVADCQNPNVVYLAWGTQTNVAPTDLVGGQDLGEFITVSMDAAATFAPPVKLSKVQGVVYGDMEAAYESQPLTRPDGTRFYAVWNQKNLTTLATVAEYVSGDIATVADSVEPSAVPVSVADSGGGGGCAAAHGGGTFDPVLWILAALGLSGWGVRRLRRANLPSNER